VSMCADVRIHLYLYVYVCVCACVCMCVVCVYGCVYMCLCACMHVYMYVHDSMCMAWRVELILRSVFQIKNLYYTTYLHNVPFRSVFHPIVHLRYVPFLRLI
jgi:hypothetical protein